MVIAIAETDDVAALVTMTTSSGICIIRHIFAMTMRWNPRPYNSSLMDTLNVIHTTPYAVLCTMIAIASVSPSTDTHGRTLCNVSPTPQPDVPSPVEHPGQSAGPPGPVAKGV